MTATMDAARDETFAMPTPSRPTARPQIAFLTAGDARNRRTWSGTPYFMGEALARHVGEVDYVGPMPTLPLLGLKALSKLAERTQGKRLLPAQSALLARLYGRICDRHLARRPPDAVVSLAGLTLVSQMKNTAPVIYSSDATLRLMLDYNPRFTNASEGAIRVADALERAAIQRADLLLYPTEWVARSAIEHYGADPAKVHIVEYGANMLETPAPPESYAPPDDVCRLLLVGVDWVHKGGEIALEALRRLRAMGVKAELTICGCVPPHPVEDEGVTVIPFLDKNDPAQRQRLVDLYRAASFLILPTRTECYGIVFCEASAYGIPSIATRTGGVPGVVREDRNGFTLPASAGGEDYAQRIASVFTDRERYTRLRISSRQEYETRLNWDVWGRKTAALLATLPRRKAA